MKKKNAENNTIKVVIENENEFSDPKEISKCIKRFYGSLFKRASNMSTHECKRFLDSIPTPSVSLEQNEILAQDITLREIREALDSSENGKSPGNDGLSREFYLTYWDKIAPVMLDSFLDGYSKGFLSTSQRQAIIKLIEKKDKDKRFIANWRPISLINFDTKILSKTLAERLKKTLPSLIKPDQTAYVSNRFLGESVRLISDILET